MILGVSVRLQIKVESRERKEAIDGNTKGGTVQEVQLRDRLKEGEKVRSFSQLFGQKEKAGKGNEERREKIQLKYLGFEEKKMVKMASFGQGLLV